MGLERLFTGSNIVKSAEDPIQIVCRYPEAADREIVAFCASALAFGRVRTVLASIESLVALMGPSPLRFITTFEPVDAQRQLRGFRHRWIRDADIVALLWMLRQMIDQHGSIEKFFAEGRDEVTVSVACQLESFSRGQWHLILVEHTGAFHGRQVSAISFRVPRLVVHANV